MSHYSLVALSLLAQGPLAALGDGVLPVPQTDDRQSSPSDAVTAPSLQSSLEVTVDAVLQSLPTVDPLHPQFARPIATQTSVQNSTRLQPNAPLFRFSPVRPAVPSSWRPVSGMQLFQQRLTALKAGKIYTRLPADSFAEQWRKATDHPTHEQWQWLLQLEAKAIANGQGNNPLNILVGDSLSVWFPHDRLPQGKLWLNQSVSGEATRHIMKRLPFLQPTQPDRIFVLAGINDLRQGVSDTVIINNWRAIVKTLRQQHPQSEIVLQSLLPTRLKALPNHRIRNLNRHLAAIARVEGATYLDLHHLFTNEEGELDKVYTTDGIHLSERGYLVWQQALEWYDAPQKLNNNYHAAL